MKFKNLCFNLYRTKRAQNDNFEKGNLPNHVSRFLI